ncbi:MAG: hypothetical protein JXA10_06485 [Anaerolineae bacterium]|nr:hypothetical protein [Anaerolineae bacterium]
MFTGRIHGVTSLLSVGIAVGLAAGVMFSEATALGAAYLVLGAGSMVAIVYAYCAKCPCKAHCGHIIPGIIATRIHRTPGPYTSAEYSVLGITLALIIGLPQIWLWQHTGLFVAFWVLTGIGLVQIRAFVCRACHNGYCPLNQGFRKSIG